MAKLPAPVISTPYPLRLLVPPDHPSKTSLFATCSLSGVTVECVPFVVLTGPPLKAERSKALPLTAHCLSPLPGF